MYIDVFVGILRVWIDFQILVMQLWYFKNYYISNFVFFESLVYLRFFTYRVNWIQCFRWMLDTTLIKGAITQLEI